MSNIVYPVHENPAVQEEIDRAVTAGVFEAFSLEHYRKVHQAKKEGNETPGRLYAAGVADDQAEWWATACGNRVRGALAVANAAGQGFKPAYLPVDPDFTGGLSSEEYVRRMRDDDDDLDGVELGTACSVDGEACESCQ